MLQSAKLRLSNVNREILKKSFQSVFLENVSFHKLDLSHTVSINDCLLVALSLSFHKHLKCTARIERKVRRSYRPSSLSPSYYWEEAGLGKASTHSPG